MFYVVTALTTSHPSKPGRREARRGEDERRGREPERRLSHHPILYLGLIEVSVILMTFLTRIFIFSTKPKLVKYQK